MKKQDIRNIYTQKVTELLNQGYTIFPDTMNGSQGEIAHIDLTNGSEILRVLLTREHRWARDEDGYNGDTICLTVGKAAPDTRVYDNWDGTVWNNRLEPRFQIEWAAGTPTWKKAAGSASSSGNATRHTKRPAGRKSATLTNRSPCAGSGNSPR